MGRSRVTAVTVRVAVAASATAVTLVVAEFGLRYVFRDAHSSADGRTFFAHRGGPSIVVNSLGFREREVAAKSSNRYRIAIVGDSFAWGQGIEERERFSNLLEASLGPRYEVLNFGIPGNNLPEHVQVLDQALQLSPDFVLLQLYINDFEMPAMIRPQAPPLLPWPTLDYWLLRSSALYDLLNDTWGQLQEATGMVETYAHYMERNLHDPNSANSREAVGLLRQFIERARAAGVRSGTVLFPNQDFSARTTRSGTYTIAFGPSVWTNVSAVSICERRSRRRSATRKPCGLADSIHTRMRAPIPGPRRKYSRPSARSGIDDGPGPAGGGRGSSKGRLWAALDPCAARPPARGRRRTRATPARAG